MALAKRVHLDAEHIADIAWLKVAHIGWAELATGVVERFSGEVERQTEPLGNSVGTANVVGVLVRDEHRPNLANVNLGRFGPFKQALTVNSRINQHGIAFISNIIAIAITT